jgi:hypothetical protein
MLICLSGRGFRQALTISPSSFAVAKHGDTRWRFSRQHCVNPSIGALLCRALRGIDESPFEPSGAIPSQKVPRQSIYLGSPVPQREEWGQACKKEDLYAQ